MTAQGEKHHSNHVQKIFEQRFDQCKKTHEISLAFPGGDNVENLEIHDCDTCNMGIISKMFVIFNGFPVLNSNESVIHLVASLHG